jgi:hypothetical protein
MRLFTFALVVLSACDLSGLHGAARSPADVCSNAMPGTQCDLLISDGRPPVVSHCRKYDDGSLVCNSDDRSGSVDH